MTLMNRLRVAVGTATENAAGDTGRTGGSLGARELPLLDLEAPAHVQTATFALG